MSYRLIVKPEAELDTLESSKWYEDQKQGLGIHFLESVRNKIGLVKQNPEHYQIRYKKTRFAFIDKFPYAIHFVLEEDVVYVLAVLSTHRDPEIWKTE